MLRSDREAAPDATGYETCFQEGVHSPHDGYERSEQLWVFSMVAQEFRGTRYSWRGDDANVPMFPLLKT